jgi:AraC family transcriptional regulator
VDEPVAVVPALPERGVERFMPMPAVRTSEEAFPGWTELKVGLYRLPPGRVTLPACSALRVSVQLSSRVMRLQRQLNGVVSVSKPSLDSININPVNCPLEWQWDNFMELAHIQIPPAFLAEMERDYGVDAQQIQCLERFNLHDAMIAEIGHTFADLLESRQPSPSTDYLHALARFLVLHLRDRYGSSVQVPRTAEKRGPDFHRIVDYIHNNLDKDLRLEQIARMSNLSNFYFIRLFKAAFGKTPHQYILECRIGLAKDLLTGSYLPISEVSQRCGFSTQSHFTSAFRQATGQSPRAFRQSYAAAGEQPSH